MSNKLFIGNLSFSASDDALNDMFSQCGTVVSAKIVTDRETGRSRGFGFVEMSSQDEASAAVERFNGADFLGRQINVSEARPQAPRSGGGGFGGGDRGGRGGFGGDRGDRGGRGSRW